MDRICSIHGKKEIQVLVKNIHGNGPLGRLRKKLEDNIKTTNANCEGVQQSQVAKKKDTFITL